MNWRIVEGDCREVLATLPERSVHTVVTSPPYFRLRDYGTGEWDGGDHNCDHLKVSDKAAAVASSTLGGGKKTTGHSQEGFGERCGKCGARRVDRQIGLEPTPDEFVAALVAVFREVRRVLRDDGTVWLNLGDSYAANSANDARYETTRSGPSISALDWEKRGGNRRADRGPSIKPKDLLGIPWMVAFALRADGWYLRSDIIWAKSNQLPESVTDRPTKSHEYLFLLSKGPRYFYDADAIREEHSDSNTSRATAIEANGGTDGERTRAAAIDASPYATHSGMRRGIPGVGTTFTGHNSAGRNKRSVWTVATQPFSAKSLGISRIDHFATFPPKLIEPCILAGAPERCCGECGAPWERVVERTENGRRIECPSDADGWAARREGQARDLSDDPVGMSGLHGQYLEVERTTLRFEPSCAHNAPTAPGVVLDPFAGAGTTGLVALRHSRSFVGVELNPEYAEMARWRIRDDAPLLNQPAETNVVARR